MAHTVFATRGILQETLSFINELSTRYLPFDYPNQETGKIEKRNIQLRVCPILLWDVSYPKEHRDLIHNTIFLDGKGGKPINKYVEKLVFPVRKAMGLQKIPKYNRERFLAMKTPNNIEVVGIGTKDDFWITEDGRHVSEQDKTPLSFEGI